MVLRKVRIHREPWRNQLQHHRVPPSQAGFLIVNKSNTPHFLQTILFSSWTSLLFGLCVWVFSVRFLPAQTCWSSLMKTTWVSEGFIRRPPSLCSQSDQVSTSYAAGPCRASQWWSLSFEFLDFKCSRTVSFVVFYELKSQITWRCSAVWVKHRRRVRNKTFHSPPTGWMSSVISSFVGVWWNTVWCEETSSADVCLFGLTVMRKHKDSTAWIDIVTSSLPLCRRQTRSWG